MKYVRSAWTYPEPDPAEQEELLQALKDLVHRVDTTELADGSSLDTAWAHAVLRKFEGEVQ